MRMAKPDRALIRRRLAGNGIAVVSNLVDEYSVKRASVPNHGQASQV